MTNLIKKEKLELIFKNFLNKDVSVDIKDENHFLVKENGEADAIFNISNKDHHFYIYNRELGEYIYLLHKDAEQSYIKHSFVSQEGKKCLDDGVYTSNSLHIIVNQVHEEKENTAYGYGAIVLTRDDKIFYKIINDNNVDRDFKFYYVANHSSPL